MDKNGQSLEALLAQVIAATRELGMEHLVALYLYGSLPGKGTDHWSDLDVCLIREDSDEGLEKGRTWMSGIYERFTHQVDPLVVSQSDLGPQGGWMLSGFLWGLKRSSRLLLGKDVRSAIHDPSKSNLRLSVCWFACQCIRRTYGIPRERSLPGEVSAPTPEELAAVAKNIPVGNAAWHAATLVMQALKAILFLEHDILCESKQELAEKLRQCGRQQLAELAHAAIQVRRSLPRWDPVVDVAGIAPLLASVPGVYSQLRDAMTACDIQDPSFEPR
jgi:hypothetical protein